MARNYYTETIIIRTFGVRRNTLRKIEDEGIVVPVIRRGERRYSQEQVAEIVFVRDLRRDMGVNWAGVEVAIEMRRNMLKLEAQMEEVLQYVKSRMEEEFSNQ